MPVQPLANDEEPCKSLAEHNGEMDTDDEHESESMEHNTSGDD